MENKFFEEQFDIRYSEIDLNKVLKPSSLLQFLEDLASKNAEALGFGYSFVQKNNLAWFLLKNRLEFFDYPENISTLKIKTAPRGCNKLFAYRDFEILNEDKILGRSSTVWGLVDINTKAVVNASQILSFSSYMPKYEKKADDLTFSKIMPIDDINIEKIFEIRFDDLDVNGHVNNTNYIVWAFEPLEFDFRVGKKLKNLDIVYKKEVKFGAKIISQVEISGDITKHVIKNLDTNEDLCFIQAEWITK